MTNQGVNFQLPSGGQFSVAVDRSNRTRIARRRAEPRLARRCPGRLSEQTRLSSASEGGRQRLTGASLSERSEQCVRSERTRFCPRVTTKSAGPTARSARSGAEQSNTAQFAPRLVSVQDETLARCGSSRERRQSRVPC
jgi:hypothetical protein